MVLIDEISTLFSRSLNNLSTPFSTAITYPSSKKIELRGFNFFYDEDGRVDINQIRFYPFLPSSYSKASRILVEKPAAQDHSSLTTFLGVAQFGQRTSMGC